MKGAKITQRAHYKVARYLQSSDRRFAFFICVSDKKEQKLYFTQGGFPDGDTIIKILEQTARDLKGDPASLAALLKRTGTDDQEVLEREIKRNPESFTKEDN